MGGRDFLSESRPKRWSFACGLIVAYPSLDAFAPAPEGKRIGTDWDELSMKKLILALAICLSANVPAATAA